MDILLCKEVAAIEGRQQWTTDVTLVMMLVSSVPPLYTAPDTLPLDQSTFTILEKQFIFLTFNFKKYKEQETPQCDETRFSTLQPSIDMTGIRNERWQ